MSERFCTPAQLRTWARTDVPKLLAAGLRQIEQLQQRSAQWQEARGQLQEKDERLAALETQLALAQREAKRQAAPFRRDPAQRTATPKKPGRPAGHPGAYRPRPAIIDEEITVSLELAGRVCPHCGGAQWQALCEREQFIEELPVTRPRVTRLRTYEAACAGCGVRTASHHPLQVSQATGAAGTHLGPRALALAADLNKAKGLPMRKTCQVLRDHFGLVLTHGGLAQALTRMAGRLQPQYETARAELRAVPALHVDETSWWVGGQAWWLWVFTHPPGHRLRRRPQPRPCRVGERARPGPLPRRARQRLPLHLRPGGRRAAQMLQPPSDGHPPRLRAPPRAGRRLPDRTGRPPAPGPRL